MLHDAHGFWLRDAGLEDVVPAAPLSGTVDADAVVVGGGYTGMWAAWSLLDSVEPDRIVLLDGGICGTGPSGRNGGFCHGLADEAEQLERRFGAQAARSLIRETDRLAMGIGEWAAHEGLDVAFRKGGEMIASCQPGHDRATEGLIAAASRLGLDHEFTRIDAVSTKAICDSPLFRCGTLAETVATVHPGRLALGLRQRLIERGVRVHEGSRVKRIGTELGRATAQTAGGRVSAAAGILAAGVGSAGFPGLRRQVTLTSSHMVMTEPVPDVLERIGWTGGQAIIDSRTLVHYMRTTDDGRIAFGWGGGAIGPGTRPRVSDSVSPERIARVIADLHRFFPDLRGRRIEHAWGGPIDAAPDHLPGVRSVHGGSWHAGFGFTGNGVGPSRSVGLLLARLALDARGELGPLAPLHVTHPTRVPPEPFRSIGGKAIMRALDSVERSGDRGHRPSRVADAIASIPDRLGYRIGR